MSDKWFALTVMVAVTVFSAALVTTCSVQEAERTRRTEILTQAAQTQAARYEAAPRAYEAP